MDTALLIDLELRPIPDPAVTHTAPGFRIEPLRAAHNAIDLEAYFSSPVAITAHSAGQWPLEGFTAADNLGLLRQHEADHTAGRAFSFALLDPTGERELGCAYLNPLGPYLARTATHLDGAPAGGWILTCWLVDDTTSRPSTEVVLRELVAWAPTLAPGPVVLRCLPEETPTVAAVAELGLDELAAYEQPLRYRWFDVG